ncbi:MAG TPA: hypothetical protein VGY57_04740, partial [Vicinamibacterales bacterium]|nr:hypothetical protein [Vicinamibacterales bacterium]
MILLAVRLASALVLLLSATHNLLSSIPFAYYMFIESPPFWWMPVLAKLQPVALVAGLWGLSGVARPSRLTTGPTRRLTLATVTAAACMAIPVLVPSAASFALSGLLCFAPLAVLIGTSAIAIRSRIRTEPVDARPPAPLAAAALAGLLSATMFALNALLARPQARALAPAEIELGSAVALACQVALFVAGWIVMAAARGVAARRSWSPAAQELATGAAAAAVLTVLLERCVVSSLMLEESRAIAVSAAYAAALVGFAMTVRLPGVRWIRGAIAAAVVAAGVFVVPPLLQFADWAFSVQKLLAMASWIAAFGLTAVVASRPIARRLLAAGLAVAWAAAVATLAAGARADGGAGRSVEAGLAIDRYATLDTSLRALLDVGRPIVSDRAFLSTLRDLGDVTYNRALPPVPFRLADSVLIDPSRVPHLFIIVIDSLRPDYVSAYNPRVAFTPAIGDFARDSIVMRRAYTAYSGTALSE